MKSPNHVYTCCTQACRLYNNSLCISASHVQSTVQQQVCCLQPLLTLQVMSDPSGGAMFVVDPKKPVGGHVIAHASTVRLSLRKGKGDQRVMKVVDSPNLREFFESEHTAGTVYTVHLAALTWQVSCVRSVKVCHACIRSHVCESR